MVMAGRRKSGHWWEERQYQEAVGRQEVTTLVAGRELLWFIVHS